MATTKIVDLISRAETITQDKTSTRWPKQEWLNWYNDAILAVVASRPDASISNESFTVNNGDTKQILPATALRLMKVVRNMASGKSIRIISANILDDQVDNWHSEQGNDVDHYVYDERDPKTFYVYPRPINASHQIEIVFSVAPAAAVIGSFDSDVTTISIDDIYMNPLLDYMLFRAYSKDADYAENANRAAGHKNNFNSELGIKSKADAAAANRTPVLP